MASLVTAGIGYIVTVAKSDIVSHPDWVCVIITRYSHTVALGVVAVSSGVVYVLVLLPTLVHVVVGGVLSCH